MAYAVAMDLPVKDDLKPGTGTQAFCCPWHPEKNPSVTMCCADDGSWLLKHCHRRDHQVYTLPEVKVGLAYGVLAKLARKDGKKSPEHMVWRLRLLYEAGKIVPYPVSASPLPSDTPTMVRKIYEGFVLLLGLKWVYQPYEPAVFSWRFAAAWRGVDEKTAAKAMQWLLRHHFIEKVGEYGRTAPGKPGRRVCYLRVSPRSIEGLIAYSARREEIRKAKGLVPIFRCSGR